MDARSSDDMGEVIEVDSNIKFAEKRKQEVEVIDLETYVFRDDTNVVNTASNSNSYATANGMDIYSNFLINGNAALANKPVYNKNARLDIVTTTTTTTTTQPRVLPEPKTKKAPVTPDEGVPDDVRKNYHVIEMEGAAVYDAMLTHTNVALNRNEFHVIQVLKADTFFSYKVYNRWGRVGEQGEIKLSGPHESCWTAVKEFEDTFFAKTKNRWSDRKNFVAYPKCYTWLEMDYKKREQKATSLPREVRKTFGPRVEKFMSLIINFAVMTKQHMTEIGYDAKKLPLNNLSKSTIMKAYDVLTLIAEVMHESPRELLQELSGEFYTIIPHDFGVKKMRDFIIDSPTKLRAKVEMVEALGEIENASKILFNCSGQKEGDIMLSQYLLLGCALTPIESSTKEYEMIANYMKNTAGSTNPKIIEIFRVSKDGEDERFRKYDRVKNRMLLWHGSRLTNYLGILSQGLRIAPQNVPLSGASFGRGLYFADMFTKSASYSAKDSKEIGILLLCEVALGEMQEIPHANSSAHKLQPGKMSTKGLGQQAPSQLKVLEDGVIIPTGSTVKQPKGSLYYNEYVVYKEDQVKMRYIVQVEYYNTTGRR